MDPEELEDYRRRHPLATVMPVMQAAVVTEFGRELQIQDVQRPTPGPGEALVRLTTSGVCHTDLHAAEGDWPVKPAGSDPVEVAPVLCAGVTVYKGLKMTEEVNAVLDEMKHAKIDGRVVLRF